MTLANTRLDPPRATERQPEKSSTDRVIILLQDSSRAPPRKERRLAYRALQGAGGSENLPQNRDVDGSVRGSGICAITFGLPRRQWPRGIAGELYADTRHGTTITGGDSILKKP